MHLESKSDPIAGSLGHPAMPDEMHTEETRQEEHLNSLKPRTYTDDEEFTNTQNSLGIAEKTVGSKLVLKADPETPPPFYKSTAHANEIANQFELDSEVEDSAASQKLAEDKHGFNLPEGKWRWETVEECDWFSDEVNDFLSNGSEDPSRPKPKKRCRKVTRRVDASDWFASLQKRKLNEDFDAVSWSKSRMTFEDREAAHGIKEAVQDTEVTIE